MKHENGFTLIEMAVVLLVLGLLLGGVMAPLSSRVDRQNYADTNTQIEQIKEALLGFAAANGRLPCPATDTSFGIESFAAGGTPANGQCSTLNGFLPAAMLGVAPVDARAFAVDAWGSGSNRIRYAVWGGASVNGVANPFTSTDGMRRATMASLAGANLIKVYPKAPCSCIHYFTNSAPFVIYSLGKTAPAGARGADELKNLDSTLVFVSHEPTALPSNPFDDQVTWGSLPTLFSRMLAAGTLP